MFYLSFQEAKGSPKDRVFTLPSISEDEEESDSEEESKSRDKQRDDDEDDVSQTSHLMSPSASVSSPLLANHRPFKLQNGDIDVFNRYLNGVLQRLTKVWHKDVYKQTNGCI